MLRYIQVIKGIHFFSRWLPSSLSWQVDPDHNWHPWHPFLRVLTSHGFNPLHQIQDILSSTNPTTSTEYMVRPFFGGNKCQILSPWRNATSPNFSMTTVIPMFSGVKSFHQTPSSAILVLPNQRIHFCCTFLSWQLDENASFTNLQAQSPFPYFASPRYVLFWPQLFPSREVKKCYHRTYLDSRASLAKCFCSIEFISYINQSGQIIYNIIPKPELIGFFLGGYPY